MPLTLITGPANAAKAGAVLERLRAALPREPLLVVPTAADVEHYQRELAGSGLVFGAEVLTFGRLIREIASRTGLDARPLGRVAGDRVVRAAIADVALRVLARSAATPGFAGAAGALFAELQRSLVTPARFTSALQAWAGGTEGAGADPSGGAAADRGSAAAQGAARGRATYADELAALYAAYRRRLERLGRPDQEGYAWAALDALRADPAAWGGRPVFLYGFDDLTPTQRDAVETLVRHAEADVLVALPYEPGRVAFAGRAATVEELRPLAGVVALPERSEYYAASARPALHHLERSLFEPAPVRRPPNGAVRLLEAGGERAEAELVGAAVLELIRQGIAVPDIAVLLRGDAGTTALFAQVLAGYGIPVSHDRRVALARTRLGAGVLAGARAALPGGTAADLLTWLRTPGRLADPAPADALDLRVRRGDLRTARSARAVWERRLGGPALAGLDALADAAAEGPGALLRALEAEAEAIWTAPHRRRAAVLAAEDLADARVAGDLRAAVGELRGLAAADPDLLGTPHDVLDALGAVEVREPASIAVDATHGPVEVREPASIAVDATHGVTSAASPPAGVLLADPLAIRARRFRAVFVCGLQDGEFPRRPVPEPFLSDEDRRGLALAAGLRLPLHEDVIDRERSLFYATASRPEDVLFLSWRSSDEEGDPQAPSAFLDDVRALFTEELWEQRGTRLLADVTWAPRDAPTPHELRRAYAAASGAPEPLSLGAPATEAVLRLLAARQTEPARGLEAFAACGVRWLIEQLLRPGRTDPDPEPMQRGSLAHTVLERTLALLRERTGSARITPERLDAALTSLADALGEGARVQTRETVRTRAVARGLEADLERYLRTEAESGAGFEPAELEWSFGGAGEAHGPLALGDEGGLVTGRVDRVDVGPGGAAIVRDYKGRTAVGGGKWGDELQLQVALYLLAVRDLLGLEPVAGLYQPLAGRKLAARGLVRDDVPGRYTRTDVVDADGFDAALDAARALATRTAADLHAGRLRPCPERCSSRGCRYPGICRAGEPAAATAQDGNGGGAA